MRSTGDRISALEEEARSVATELRTLMLGLPNLPLEDVPEGLDESFNEVVSEVEPPPARDWDTPHWDIGDNPGHHRHGERGEYLWQPFLHVARVKARGCIERSSDGCSTRWLMSLGMRRRIRRIWLREENVDRNWESAEIRR